MRSPLLCSMLCYLIKLIFKGSVIEYVTWTNSATITLLKLYENKLEMLRTPKRKTRIWLAISESLRDYNIEVSVRVNK